LADVGDDDFVGDFFDHCFGVDVDVFFPEGGFGVLDERLGEAGEDTGESFHQRDFKLVCDFFE
jgi:hypothetical protein